MKVQDFDELRSKESQDTGKGSVYFIYIFTTFSMIFWFFSKNKAKSSI